MLYRITHGISSEGWYQWYQWRMRTAMVPAWYPYVHRWRMEWIKNICEQRLEIIRTRLWFVLSYLQTCLRIMRTSRVANIVVGTQIRTSRIHKIRINKKLIIRDRYHEMASFIASKLSQRSLYVFERKSYVRRLIVYCCHSTFKFWSMRVNKLKTRCLPSSMFLCVIILTYSFDWTHSTTQLGNHECAGSSQRRGFVEMVRCCISKR